MKHTAMSVVLLMLIALPISAANPTRPLDMDQSLLALAAAIPGFGGLYYEHGQPNVYLVGTEGLLAARQRFGQNVHVLPAKYDLPQLSDWRGQLRSVLSMKGAVSLDLDESRNRVVIGIDRATAATERPLFAQRVAALNVPTDAVIIENSDPIYPVQTLQDDVRPQKGGVQIDFSQGTNTFHCTLGFNVAFEKGNGFVTCSHCTAVRSEEDGDYVGWGIEERDPPFFTSGCPSGRVCRYSDSALIYYAFGVEQGAGDYVAKTDSSTTCGSGSLTIDANTSFQVTATGGSPYVGQSAEKVGRTTGWTSGNVTATCVDTNVAGGNITLLCQDFADFGLAGGDSGSPVFHQTGNNNIALDGILWGSNSSCVAIFSPISSVLYEIGPVTVP